MGSCEFPHFRQTGQVVYREGRVTTFGCCCSIYSRKVTGIVWIPVQLACCRIRLGKR
jgi:hypothetical protein